MPLSDHSPTERSDLPEVSTGRVSDVSYRQLFEAAPHGVLIIDASNGKVIDANPAMNDLLGHSQEELMGRELWEICPFEGNAASKLFARLQQADQLRYEGIPLKTKEGRLIEVEFINKAYLSEGRWLIQCNMRDITERMRERRRLEEQFIAAQKMEVMGQLAGGVAHDFNNILAVILGYSGLLSAGLGKSSPLQQYAEEILRASERAAGLTRQLLIFSRKQTVVPVVLELNEVMKDLEIMLRRVIDETIEMVVSPSKASGHILADAGYVGQVLMNLVVNARDAMPNGGRLVISTSNVTVTEFQATTGQAPPPGEYVMMSVGDTGTGMTPEVRARLFEAFFTTKGPGKGTGLGLATVQTIVQLLGGCIVVRSEPGQGSTFEVYFPQVPPAAHQIPIPSTNDPLPRGTETLMIVEDETAVRELACGVLTAQGYEVLQASNGQEGLRVAREHGGPAIQLVITDVVMPVMNGKVMAEWLKATYPDLRILFTSGYTDDAIAQHGVLDPGVAYLPKPYTPATLLYKVREMLDAPTLSPPL